MSHRRDNDLSLPNPDHGSYKLTISPSGESLERNSIEESLIDNKMTTLIHHHNNNSCHNLLQRVSASLGSLNGLNKTAETLINNLPDVLPMNAKVPRNTRSSAPNPYIHPIDNQMKTVNGNPLKISPPNTPRNISQPRFSLESSLRQYNTINGNIQSARVTPMRTEYVQPLISPKEETMSTEPIKLLESPLPSPEKIISEEIFNVQDEISLELPTNEIEEEIVTSPIKSEPTPVQFAANYIEVKKHFMQQSSIQEDHSPETVLIRMTDRACSPVHSDAESPKSVRSTRSQMSNSSSPIQKEIIEVQPMQRTELVLRVNSYTSDAASQTEKEELLTIHMVKTPLLPRQKSPEELDCEELSRAFVSHLSPNDRLQGILGILNLMFKHYIFYIIITLQVLHQNTRNPLIMLLVCFN